MQQNCLLISPPGELNIFPRGIMEIASFLNIKGCPTSVLPLGHHIKNDYKTDEGGYILEELDDKELCRIIEDVLVETQPTVVGISNCYTKDFHNCIKIIQMCKRIRPQAITVIGGQHATFCDQQSLECPELDVVVRGEGEWTMLNLLRAIQNKDRYDKVGGISFRKNGGIHRNPNRFPGKMEDLPPVDYRLLPREFVQTTQIHGILSRGCAYHCKYCVEEKFWGYPRWYGLQKLIDEMTVLQKDYGTQIIGMEESMLDMRSNIFFKFCRQIKDHRIELPEQFYLTTRIDSVTDEGIRQMQDLEIKFLCTGLENFSDRVLMMMNKKQNYDSILQGCEKLKQKNIWVNSYWLIGHPGDNSTEAEYTYSKFKRFFEKGLLKSGNAFIFVPYPGTEFFIEPHKYGIIIGSYEWKRWKRWTEEPVSWLENFSATEISHASKKAWKLLDDYRRLNGHLYKHLN